MTNGGFTLPGEITLSDIKFGDSRGNFWVCRRSWWNVTSASRSARW